MLINNTPSIVGSIVATKLLNGDEVMGKCTAETAKGITIERPVVVKLVPIGNGQGAPALTPFGYTFTTDAKFDLDFDRMLMKPVAVMKEAADLYLRETSSIEIAQPGIQL